MSDDTKPAGPVKHELQCPMFYMRAGTECICLCGDDSAERGWYERRRHRYQAFDLDNERLAALRHTLGMAIAGGIGGDQMGREVDGVLTIAGDIMDLAESIQKAKSRLISLYGEEYGAPARYGNWFMPERSIKAA